MSNILLVILEMVNQEILFLDRSVSFLSSAAKVREEKEENEAATKIQARWKGNKAREKLQKGE